MLSFGQRLKLLRNEADISQSDLADALGVSAQSVSKWECDLYCPDVSMLLPLAGVLGVTTDCLLGAGTNEKKDIEELQKEIDEIYKEKPWNEYENNAAYCEYLARAEFLKKYPFNYKVKYLAAFSLFQFLWTSKSCRKYEIPEEEYAKLFNTGIKMLLFVTERDNDPTNLVKSRFTLIDYYTMNDEYDKAEAVALEMPDLGFIRDNALFEIECDKGDHSSMERRAEDIAMRLGKEYLRFMFWRGGSISASGNARRREVISKYIEMEAAAVEYDKAFFASWIARDYDPDEETSFEWVIDAITHQASSYLGIDDVSSSLDCLERAERFGIGKLEEATALGADSQKREHLLKEIKKIPYACWKYVFSDENNTLTKEERYKACKARIDALE